jgi:unsaturated chondroitin disaccharide hydrolase
MALHIYSHLTARQLRRRIESAFELSAHKILALEKSWAAGAGRRTRRGTPVLTVRGRYTTRGWTEWTQGFQFGSALLQYDATGERRFLELGRERTVTRMAPHLSHVGVHDHGFNNISTYGNLLRLMREEKIPFDPWEQDFYALALKMSGAVQACRWARIDGGGGYIYSFNGPQSLFVDTIRSLRSRAVAYRRGHRLWAEQDEEVPLLERLIEHGLATATYNVFYGTGRDVYDVRGRTAHESLFNPVNGRYRCPSTQQGYSPFSTWTRGLAWAICGFSEQLEFLATLTDRDLPRAGRRHAMAAFEKAACATADFYVENSCRDGIPMWDTGAPNLHRLGDYLRRPADPFNRWEPVDSSAAAIAAQGLVRLGNYLRANRREKAGAHYRQAGLTVARTLFSEPYLTTDPKHHGLLSHSVYHRPNGWDYVARGEKVPNGESSLWGDYHLRELGLLLLREARAEPYLTFFGIS